MLPVIALIGRPNVGKSTLFNRLTRSRDALVADYSGLTRDRQYGFGKLGPMPYLVIDTGGVAGGEEGIDELWGEPFKAFTMPIEKFYESRYIKIAQTMRDIDAIAGAMVEMRCQEKQRPFSVASC